MPGVVELVIIFAVSWWIVFIPILGVGTESQDQSGDVIEGTDAGAPTDHMLPKKALWATIGAAIMTVIASFVISIVR